MANAKKAKDLNKPKQCWQPYSIRRRILRMCSDGASISSISDAFKVSAVTIYSWMQATGVKAGMKLTEAELSLAMGDWKTKFPDNAKTRERVKTLKRAFKKLSLPDGPTPSRMMTGLVAPTPHAIRQNYSGRIDVLKHQVMERLNGSMAVEDMVKMVFAAAHLDILKDALVSLPQVEKLSDLKTLQSMMFEAMDIGGKGEQKRQRIDLRILNMDPKKVKVVDAEITQAPADVAVEAVVVTTPETPDSDESDPDFALYAEEEFVL